MHLDRAEDMTALLLGGGDEDVVDAEPSLQREPIAWQLPPPRQLGWEGGQVEEAEAERLGAGARLDENHHRPVKAKNKKIKNPDCASVRRQVRLFTAHESIKM